MTLQTFVSEESEFGFEKNHFLQELHPDLSPCPCPLSSEVAALSLARPRAALRRALGSRYSVHQNYLRSSVKETNALVVVVGGGPCIILGGTPVSGSYLVSRGL